MTFRQTQEFIFFFLWNLISILLLNEANFLSPFLKIFPHFRFNDCAADSKECRYADIIRILSPDVVVFLTSLFAVLSCRSLSLHTNRPGQMSLQFEQPNSYLGEIIPVFVGLMLLLGGIIQPNVLTSVYFLAFLILGICWAFHLLDHLKQNTSFLVFKLFLTVYAGLHLILLYLYQFPFMQTAVLPDTFLPRYSFFLFNTLSNYVFYSLILLFITLHKSSIYSYYSQSLERTV